ncbi:MAG: replication-associated recombination protein A [Desulfobacterales bacterium]|nr:replication-associated recombination protein A [Desulfobacterales bacterium]
MRPKKLMDIVGQSHIIGSHSLIQRVIQNNRLFSMILWGPPGCGKTTLARILIDETKSHGVEISAMMSGVKDIKRVVDEAMNHRRYYHQPTILFVDEIHRFNKAQQDAFLPHVENGLITLIGATTENPSFELISALLSRCRVIVLNPLTPKTIEEIIDRALADKESGLGLFDMGITEDAKKCLSEIADGDARRALNILEIVAYDMLDRKSPSTDEHAEKVITINDITPVLQKQGLRYDKSGENHYNMISAFHKSLRGSDPDAAVYWLGRMLCSGENPFYILRRMVRFASEDIGVADSYALHIALNAMESYRFLGSPEGECSIYQAAVYLATAPKSNRIYKTEKFVQQVIQQTGSLSVPVHICNAPTDLMKDMGYGKDYQYPHDHPDAIVYQDYLPDAIRGTSFYEPTDRGYEKIIKQRLDAWKIKKQEIKLRRGK